MFDKLNQVKELKKMRDQAMKIQKELDSVEIEVEKDGVTVKVTASQKIVSININGNDEKSVVKAVNEAISQSQKVAAKRMQSMMGEGGNPFAGLMG
ncbi:YbaB/EbfC family nucleoid-associated protein [Candidatus Curtissbacteria bacterium]|nr:YbaB/EbfC family nucleoid-associated protein [Candidatus Curtissbacteria bacterium]